MSGTLWALQGGQKIARSHLRNLERLVQIIGGDKSHDLVKSDARQLELSLLGLCFGFNHQCNRQIGVNKKAAPDRERGAGDSNVHAPRGMCIAEKRRRTHIQYGSPLSLQKH